jgi:hypothetical protein
MLGTVLYIHISKNTVSLFAAKIRRFGAGLVGRGGGGGYPQTGFPDLSD